MAHFDAVEEVDEEELAIEYDELCGDVCDLAAELRASAIEIQQMRMRLKVALQNKGGADAASGPAALPEPAVLQEAQEQQLEDMRNLLQWLAEHVDLDSREVLDVGFEVPVGGRTVQLLRIMQWPLASAFGGQLRLSAPIEHHERLAALLSAVRAGGSIAPEALRAFTAEWELVAGELLAATQVTAEPSVLLAHRHSPAGVLVARWPTREALEAFHSLHSSGVEVPRVGDRVEVEYEGCWYAGVLHSVDASGKAGVKCDVDAPGVLTVTPLHRLRRIASPCVTQESAASIPGLALATAEKRRAAGHRRTRSSAL